MQQSQKCNANDDIFSGSEQLFDVTKKVNQFMDVASIKVTTMSILKLRFESQNKKPILHNTH